MESDREMASEAVYSFIGPFLGIGTGSKWALRRDLYVQMDVAMVVTGVKGNKALVWTPKENRKWILATWSPFRILSYPSILRNFGLRKGKYRKK